MLVTDDIVQKTLEKITLAIKTNNWSAINQELSTKRLAWLAEHWNMFPDAITDVRRAYLLLMAKLDVTTLEAPVVFENREKIIWHSRNPCPVLEACQLGGYDTREVCKRGYEQSVQLFVEQVNPHLVFSRNYKKIRPHADLGFCEEMIEIQYW
ncbi:MAG: hypothetical protein V1837_01370 [Candidatus Woesearchaeota archaeon]